MQDRATWARRHPAVVVAILALLALGVDAGYQVYAARIQSRNAVTAAKVRQIAPKVNRLTDAACASTRLFYEVFNALVVDSSPAFGSPPDGPIVPGARARLIARLYAAERAAATPLRAQGCKVPAPPG